MASSGGSESPSPRTVAAQAAVELMEPDMTIGLGSGRAVWTVIEAIERGVATPVISAALHARFVSQADESLGMKVVAALRNEFGGHAVLPETDERRR